jgi:broad specificity phosphatase PhoE
MTIYLVRHARAGNRSAWRHDDWLRPLSRAGRSQARGLLDLLSEARFDHVLSSPYVRCLETVLPIAGARRLPIEPDDALGEGGELDAVLAIMRKHIGNGALLCSHGDIIPAVLSSLAANGVDIGEDPPCPKGCTWVLDADSGADISRVRYIPPPPEPEPEPEPDE